MSIIKYENCKSFVNAKVVYVFKIYRETANGPITRVQCAEHNYGNFFENIKWVDASELAKSIYNDEIVAWGGTVDNTNNCFRKICKIIPMKKGGQLFLTSVNDENDENNLENFVTGQ